MFDAPVAPASRGTKWIPGLQIASGMSADRESGKNNTELHKRVRIAPGPARRTFSLFCSASRPRMIRVGGARCIDQVVSLSFY
jgi:hypothetical protein